MRLALIGFGQAGGKIADRFVEYDAMHDLGIIEDVMAVNSARADLNGLEHVPEERRVLIGTDEVKGNGVGADNETGRKVAEDDVDVLLNEVNDIGMHRVDAFLVVAGLGGGTGSGGAPVIARELSERYPEPVYGLGVLPAENEGGIYTMNAARSLQTFVDEVDNLMLFDNDEWRETGESVAEGYDQINHELVRRFSVMFAAGIPDNSTQAAESVVDSSEIINTLDCGGLTSIGYASEEVEREGGIVSSILGGGSSDDEEKGPESVNRITSLTRQATLGRLTLPCNQASAKRALVIVAGPPEKLSRKGIENARQWLEDEAETMEVRGGDYPVDEDQISVTVLLSGVDDSNRVRDMQEKAVKAKHNIEDLRSESDDLNDIAKTDSDDIDSLF